MALAEPPVAVSRPVVVHVYDFLHPHTGGPPQVIIHLAKAQLDQGYHIRLISIDADDPEVIAFVVERLGAEVELIRLHPKWIRPALSKKLIDAQLSDASAVHLHSIWPTPNLFFSYRCTQLGIPYLLSIHGHLRAEALAIKSLKKRIGLLLGYRAMLYNATAIHALNQSEQEEVRRFGLDAPCFILPNGISSEEFKEAPQRSVLTRVCPELGEAPYLLFLSRIHPPKGARDLATAFTRLYSLFPDLHLVVAGTNDGGVEEVIQVMEAAGVRDKLHLPGFLEGEEKAAAFRYAEAFCLPSYHEGFSVAVLESLAWGTATVISTGCHFPEVANEGVGWVHPVGADALYDTLCEVLSDPVKREERAQRGHDWVHTHFSWYQIERGFHKIYQVLAQPAPSSTQTLPINELPDDMD